MVLHLIYQYPDITVGGDCIFSYLNFAYELQSSCSIEWHVEMIVNGAQIEILEGSSCGVSEAISFEGLRKTTPNPRIFDNGTEIRTGYGCSDNWINGFKWLKTGSSGELLWIRYWTRRRYEIYWPDGRLSVYIEGHWSIDGFVCKCYKCWYGVYFAIDRSKLRPTSGRYRWRLNLIAIV
jgi:hypothetical protein